MQLDVFTVDVSYKTTWIWFRLVDGNGHEGVGEATLNNRVDELLAALPAATDAFSASDHGIAEKLRAVRQSASGVVGRAISSGLEQAWLDIEGKRTERPIHVLFGGAYRSSVACYANINRGTLSRQPAEFAERAAAAIADGYTAVKLAPFDDVTPDDEDNNRRSALVEAGVERIAAVTKQIGGLGRTQVDCHSRLKRVEAQDLLERLAGLGVSWLEEPIQETETALATIGALKSLAQSRGVTLAGAEQAAGLADFLPFCHARCYDVIMPDIILAGGPAEVVRIGYLAAAVNQAVSLHNPSGPVMDMHSAHVAAAVPELHSLERQYRESPLYDDLVTRVHKFEGGAYHLSDSPGLGLTVDWTSPEVNQRLSIMLKI